jgi:hypothetical protein
MKLFTAVIAISLALALMFMQRPADAQANFTEAMTLLMNNFLAQLPVQVAQILRICITGFPQALIVALLDLSRQVLYMCKSIAQDNPELLQGLVTSIAFSTILFGAMGTVCPVIGNLICGGFGFVIGIPIGLVDGCLRWFGFYNVSQSQLEAAKRQAELNRVNNPQQVIIIPG